MQGECKEERIEASKQEGKQQVRGGQAAIGTIGIIISSSSIIGIIGVIVVAVATDKAKHFKQWMRTILRTTRMVLKSLSHMMRRTAGQCQHQRWCQRQCWHQHIWTGDYWGLSSSDEVLYGDKRVWTCGWCPNESDGTHPKPFLGWNTTKTISHVCCIPGMCIHLCSGSIPLITPKITKICISVRC